MRPGLLFKDGPKKAPTMLNQIVDGFAQMQGMYEAKWARAKKEI